MSQSDFLVNVTICAQWNLKLKIKGVTRVRSFFISSAAKAELKLRLVSVVAMPILMGFIS
jgi:hypothetical protein